MARNLKTTGAIRGRLSLENISADRTLTVEDTGKVFLMDATGEDITIPNPTDASCRGVHYTFVCNAKISSSSWTVTSLGTDLMHGQLGAGGTGEADVISAGTGQEKYTFVSGAADEGDSITVFSTGTYWIVTGQSHAKANITDAVE